MPAPRRTSSPAGARSCGACRHICPRPVHRLGCTYLWAVPPGGPDPSGRFCGRHHVITTVLSCVLTISDVQFYQFQRGLLGRAVEYDRSPPRPVNGKACVMTLFHRVCWRCGRWGTRQFNESGRSDAVGIWECSNDRACQRRAKRPSRARVSRKVCVTMPWGERPRADLAYATNGITLRAARAGEGLAAGGTERSARPPVKRRPASLMPMSRNDTAGKRGGGTPVRNTHVRSCH